MIDEKVQGGATLKKDTKMAIKLHPDRGGDEKQMKLLNNIKDKLESIY